MKWITVLFLHCGNKEVRRGDCDRGMKACMKHDDDEKSILADFKMMRAEDDESKAIGAKSESYLTILNWFLDKFPEVREYHEKRGTATESSGAGDTM